VVCASRSRLAPVVSVSGAPGTARGASDAIVKYKFKAVARLAQDLVSSVMFAQAQVAGRLLLASATAQPGASSEVSRGPFLKPTSLSLCALVLSVAFPGRYFSASLQSRVICFAARQQVYRCSLGHPYGYAFAPVVHLRRLSRNMT
jgi:hypothetical protein